MLIDDRLHDRLRTREELSLSDSAENRAFHDSPSPLPENATKRTNERTNDSERFFLTRAESRKRIMKSMTSHSGSALKRSPTLGGAVAHQGSSTVGRQRGEREPGQNAPVRKIHFEGNHVEKNI